MHAPTISDIAKKAGLSVSTVSRVLNNKSQSHRISRDTAELIIKTAAEMSYRPNAVARSLRLKKTNTIGLVVPDISNPFFAHITRGIQRAAHGAGYSLVVCDTDEDLRQEVEHVNLLKGKGVDGLIVMPVGLSFDHLKEVYDRGVPIVLLDRCIDVLNATSVQVDNHDGAYQAVEHIIKCGHTRIAIIQGLSYTYTSSQRLRGYMDALMAGGVDVDEGLIVGSDFRQENGYIETKLLLRKEDPPTAIFATSDLITLGALQAIFEDRMRVPEDISLVSFDDIDFAPYLIVPLTTVAQPKELMSEIAVKLLVEQIGAHESVEPKKIVLKPQLTVRGSVKSIQGLKPKKLM